MRSSQKVQSVFGIMWTPGAHGKRVRWAPMCSQVAAYRAACSQAAAQQAAAQQAAAQQAAAQQAVRSHSAACAM